MTDPDSQTGVCVSTSGDGLGFILDVYSKLNAERNKIWSFALGLPDSCGHQNLADGRKWRDKRVEDKIKEVSQRDGKNRKALIITISHLQTC